MKQIPFFNYPLFASRFESELVDIFSNVIKRGAFILQSDLVNFEELAREFLGSKYFLGVADGTNALLLSLLALGIKEGDEVILPSHTYIASAAAVHFVNATPVLVDCNAVHLIEPKSIRSALSNKTKAIMPVHLNGRTCEMDEISLIASENGLAIIEDAAQAFGAKYKKKSAGTFGQAAGFSFFPAKVLGCLGDGGGIATNDQNLYEKLYWLRDHGRDKSGEVVGWGTNCRLDNLQAAFLTFFLKRLPETIERRREIASRYHKNLAGIKDLVLPIPPSIDDNNFDTFQNYEIESNHRNELKAYLETKGVKTLIQWGGVAVHQFPHVNFQGNLPATDLLFKRCLLLPMNSMLSDEEVDYISTTIHNFYSSK